MISSGRASLIAYGNYEKVYKASYKLLPGDFVAYEKKGKVTHISVVTGADSKVILLLPVIIQIETMYHGIWVGVTLILDFGWYVFIIDIFCYLLNHIF